MIETREQRKKSTLLHRRKVGIIAFLLVVVILGTACISLFSYFNNTIPFKDADGTTYYIKKIDGLFAMTDKQGSILPTEKALDSSEWYYVTTIGTTVRVDQQTGEYLVRSIPALYYQEDGEFVDHELLTVFKSVESKNIRVIMVKNQVDEYAFFRWNIQEAKMDDSCDFVLTKAPLASLDADLMSYFLYIVGHPLVHGRLEDPIKDENGNFSEYGLVPEKRVDEEGNEYDYYPTTITIETTSDETHTVIIGDRLVDGNGYYLQYEDGDGEKRDAVYIFNPTDMTSVNGTSIHNTIFAEAKSLVVPNIIYPATETDYLYVENFKIHEREEDGRLDQLIGFSYIDMDEREGTVEENHPYKFIESSYKSYRPNYDSINLVLRHLMEPVVTDIAVLMPNNDDKVAHNLMVVTGKDEEGNNIYEYNSKYVISFERTITSTEFKDEMNVRITLYVSDKNENGNFYTFTEMEFLNRPEDTDVLGISFDTICEVSSASLNFLEWEPYDWVYPIVMQYNISYTSKMEISSPDKGYSFELKTEKIDKFNVLTIETTKPDNSVVSTFGALQFKDSEGNYWTVTDTKIQMYGPDGTTELKPATRHYEYNMLGEQAQVIDQYATADNGDLVYIETDSVRIHRSNGTKVEYFRSGTPLFRKLFSTITSTMLIDSYELTEEEEKALVSDPANKLATVKVTDNNGRTITYEYFSLTDRKSYVLVDGMGGFFVQSSQIRKIFSDIEKFLANEIIDPKAGT